MDNNTIGTIELPELRDRLYGAFSHMSGEKVIAFLMDYFDKGILTRQMAHDMLKSGVTSYGELGLEYVDDFTGEDPTPNAIDIFTV